MKVWVIAEISITWGGGVCIRVYIYIGLVNKCVIAKFSLSESKREFLYYIF